MLVCVCNGVSDRDIESALQDGASSYKEVRSALGIGSCCGQCKPYAKEMVGEKIAEAQVSNSYQLAYEVRV